MFFFKSKLASPLGKVEWQPNTSHCSICNNRVGKRVLNLRHHCRSCGSCVCGKCSQLQTIQDHQMRICKNCSSSVSEDASGENAPDTPAPEPFPEQVESSIHKDSEVIFPTSSVEAADPPAHQTNSEAQSPHSEIEDSVAVLDNTSEVCIGANQAVAADGDVQRDQSEDATLISTDSTRGRVPTALAEALNSGWCTPHQTTELAVVLGQTTSPNETKDSSSEPRGKDDVNAAEDRRAKVLLVGKACALFSGAAADGRLEAALRQLFDMKAVMDVSREEKPVDVNKGETTVDDKQDETVMEDKDDGASIDDKKEATDDKEVQAVPENPAAVPEARARRYAPKPARNPAAISARFGAVLPTRHPPVSNECGTNLHEDHANTNGDFRQIPPEAWSSVHSLFAEKRTNSKLFSNFVDEFGDCRQTPTARLLKGRQMMAIPNGPQPGHLLFAKKKMFRSLWAGQ